MYTTGTVDEATLYERYRNRKAITEQDIIFLTTCKRENLIPTFANVK